jgi:small membrane protein
MIIAEISTSAIGGFDRLTAGGPEQIGNGNFLWIKILLILLLLIILRAFMVGRSLLLIKRLSAFGLFVILVLLVLFPQVSNLIANKLGVGRGVDLLFYLSHLFLLLLIVSLWRRLVGLADAVTKLTRQIAIQNANKPQDRDLSSDTKSSR